MRRRLALAEDVVLAILMVLLLADVSLQIVARYVSLDLTWTEELARYIFIYATFIGSVAAIRDRSHVGIDVCVARLPPRLQLVVSLAVDIITIAAFAFLLYWSVQTAVKVQILRSVALQISFAAIYAIVPVSLTLMIARLVWRMVDDVHRHRQRHVANTLAGAG